MLEVINGFLLLYFLILCTLSALVPNLVKPIASCFNKKSNEEQIIRAEILKLKSQQKDIPMKDEFAAFAKLQRKIINLEKELKDNTQNRMSRNLTIKGSVHLILQTVITLTIVISVIWCRHQPIVVLKGDLFPLTTMLKYPSDEPNAISTHVWVLISNLSIRTLIKPLL